MPAYIDLLICIGLISVEKKKKKAIRSLQLRPRQTLLEEIYSTAKINRHEWFLVTFTLIILTSTSLLTFYATSLEATPLLQTVLVVCNT